MMSVCTYYRYVKKVCLAFFLLCIVYVCSQIPGLINYNQANGLNSSYIYHLRQDANGFIWIGTGNGLYRFDGINFTQYGKKSGLKNTDVISCEPMDDGEIFIVPFLEDFAYMKGNTIINSDLNPELKKIKCGIMLPRVNYNKKLNEVVIYSINNPQNIYLYKNGKVKVIPVGIDNHKNGPITAINFKAENNTLYYRAKDGSIIAYNVITKISRKCNSNADLSEVIFVRDNIFITIANRKIVTIYVLENDYSFRKVRSIESLEDIYSVVIDKNHNLWIAQDQGGVLYYDQPLNKAFKSKKPVKFLEDCIINYILADQDNNIWFATRNNGLFFIAEAPFHRYVNMPLENNSSYITSIAANSKNIFLGYNITSGGLYHSGILTDLVFKKNKKIENKAVYANDMFAYFGQTDDVFEYDISKKKVRSLHVNTTIKNLIPYRRNKLLICASDGIKLYDPSLHTIKRIWNQRIYTALPYSSDSIFTGTFKDLYKLNIVTRKVKPFLNGYYFTDLKQLTDNLYLGASNSKGILLFNNKKIIAIIGEEQGLKDVQIKKVTVENKKTFWASTENGLIRIELTRGKPIIKTFTITDGLPSDNISGVVIKGDSIFVGTSKGMGILSIKRLLTQQKHINKKVIINSVSVDGKEYVDPFPNLTSEEVQNDLTFNLSFLDYASQGKINFKYKLEGLNNKWQTTNSSKIIFSTLPPGKYTFKVYGLGYNGKQSYAYTQIPFEIKPQFWQTIGFRILFIISILAVLLGAVTFYFRKKRDKQLKDILTQKRFAELELHAIKAQINPHFIYNCLNSINFLLYKRENNDAKDYLKTFSQMIRKTLHYSEKTFMLIPEEIEYLTLYLEMEKLRFKERFDYKINISGEVHPQWVIPSLLIQPFVENAIKHGIQSLKDRKGIIKIDFLRDHGELCVIIEDNGVGIRNKAVLTPADYSFGIKLSQKRIETFKQLFDTEIKLEVIDLYQKKLQQGTQIKLYISQNENKNTSVHH